MFGECTHYHHWSLHLESTVRMRLCNAKYDSETGSLSYKKKVEGLSLEVRKINVPLHATSWRVARDFLDTRWLDMATYAFSPETN